MTERGVTALATTPRPSRNGRRERRRRRRAWAAIAITCAGLALPVPPAGADNHQCGTVVLPVGAGRTVSLHHQSVSGDGNLVAYETWRPPQQPGDPTHPRAVLFNADDGEVTELGSSLFSSARFPLLSNDGSTVAFKATVDGRQEVFTYDVATGEYDRVTSTIEGERNPSPTALSADGTRILYSIEPDLDFDTVNYALRLVDTATGVTHEVVEDAGPRAEWTTMAISGDGMLVAFASDRDLTGANPDKNAEIHLYDTATEILSQVTDTQRTVGDNREPAFVGDPPSRIVFASDADIVGTPPDTELHLYSYDLATGNLIVVNERGRFDILSTDGSTVAYTAHRNTLGTNPDRSEELFAFHRPSRTTTQLTDLEPPWGSQPVAIAPTGAAVVFASDGNHDGANPNHQVRYLLARTCPPAPMPDARIATAPTGPEAGNDIYSSRPSTSQQRTATIAPGTTRAFTARVQNDRATTDTFVVKGVDTGAPGYLVSYWRGATNITAAVRAGTYRTGPIASGRSATITIKVTEVSAMPGSTRTVDLTATSRTNPVAADAVRAKVRRP